VLYFPFMPTALRDLQCCVTELLKQGGSKYADVNLGRITVVGTFAE